MRQVFSWRFFTFSLIVAAVYFALSIYSLNFKLVLQTLNGNYPVVYKLKIIDVLLTGVNASMDTWGLILLILTSLFTGFNVYLIAKRMKYIKSQKDEKEVEKVGFLTGVGTFLGIIGAGCASCSLPILALLGFSSSLVYLPFRGAEISYISLGLLILSFVILIRSQLTIKACQIKVN